MQTQTLVQASATVVTIVNLTKGDVYKRLEKDYAEKHKLIFGIVTSVMHNGTDAVITAIEFEASYSGIEAKQKVFANDNDLKLFAAEPAEVELHLVELIEAGKKGITLAEAEVIKKQQSLAHAEEAFRQAQQGGLTAALKKTVEVTK